MLAILLLLRDARSTTQRLTRARVPVSVVSSRSATSASTDPWIVNFDEGVLRLQALASRWSQYSEPMPCYATFSRHKSVLSGPESSLVVAKSDENGGKRVDESKGPLQRKTGKSKFKKMSQKEKSEKREVDQEKENDGKPSKDTPEKYRDEKDKKEENDRSNLDVDKREKEKATEVISKVKTPVSGASASAPSGNNGNNGGNDKDRLASPQLPSTMPYPPLLAVLMKDRPQLPGRLVHVQLIDPQVIKAMQELLRRGQPHFLLFFTKDTDGPDSDIITSKAAVHEIGVHCQAVSCMKLRDGLVVFAYPLKRCRLETLFTPTDAAETLAAAGVEEDFPTSYLRDFGVSYGLISNCADEPYDLDNAELKALVDRADNLLEEVSRLLPDIKISAEDLEALRAKPEALADMIGLLTKAPAKDLQDLLQELNIPKRLEKAIRLFQLELQAGEVIEKSLKEMNSRIDEQNAKLFIKDFLKTVERRAGLEAPKTPKLLKFDKRLLNLKLSDEAMEAYVTESEKLQNHSENLGEYGVVEKYLDWLTSLPWGLYTKDRFDLAVARAALDRDHYGMKDLKDRILEFIAMCKVSGKVDGKIVCLVGPPGTGKTSIAKSIAEALDRKYARIAVGGMKDVSEIKGHKRTYIGSTPGRFISSLKQVKASNPLFVIDEIDKMDYTINGAAASALLEVLDPEQNDAFVDSYLDVKVDLSKVLFVCTANDVRGITGPLRDRMEIMEVSGYTNYEKLMIAEKHVIPKTAEKAGIDPKHIVIRRDALETLIENYCSESGLRNVKKLISRIFSKAAYEIVEKIEAQAIKNKDTELTETTEETAETFETSSQNPETTSALTTSSSNPSVSHSELSEKEENIGRLLDESELQAKPMDISDDIVITVTRENLKDYVGPELHTPSEQLETLPPGVATGLTYNYSGSGDTMHIESVLTNSIASGAGHAGINATGNLGDVMKESSQIAYSYARLFMAKKFPENRFFEAAEIHVNCPEGAIPKEGPSAGIAYVSSLISLATNEALPSTIAMTGEISLTGKVLPIGGLREKILGAKRNKCNTVIFPKESEKLLDEIPEEIKKDVTLIPVLWYDEVFGILFKDRDTSTFGSVWEKDFAQRKALKDPK